MPLSSRAFTLIELLIVVAIIAILAAIAVPTFLEAQTRSKLARARSDMRTFATGLEAYCVDANTYPPHAELLTSGQRYDPARRAGLATFDFMPGGRLTTPIAYLSSMLIDPFAEAHESPEQRTYGYIESTLMKEILLGKGFVTSAENLIPTYGGYRIYSAGPDTDRARDAKLNVLYDPTNGTLSDGDLVRTQKNPTLMLSRDEK